MNEEKRDMIVKPLVEESLGARSMCTYVETPDVKILMDPGASLPPRRFGLPPHPLEYRALMDGRERILRYAAEAEIVTISHYHFDHHTPSFEEWCCHWSSPEIARRIYEGKLLLVKDFRRRLGYSQRRRGWLFLKTGAKYAREVKNADGRSFILGKTRISFSEPLYHGVEGSELGSVIMASVEREGEKMVFASDIQGPMYDLPLREILDLKPRLLIIGGPPLYLSGFKVREEDVDQGIKNLAELAKKIPEMVLGHHLLRGEGWREAAKPVFDGARRNGNRVLTFSQFLGVRERILESKRRTLYEEDPPDEEFLKWSRVPHQKRRSIKPPIGTK